MSDISELGNFGNYQGKITLLTNYGNYQQKLDKIKPGELLFLTADGKTPLGYITPTDEAAVTALITAAKGQKLNLYISEGSAVKFAGKTVPTGAVLNNSYVKLGETAQMDHALIKDDSDVELRSGRVVNSSLTNAIVQDEMNTTENSASKNKQVRTDIDNSDIQSGCIGPHTKIKDSKLSDLGYYRDATITDTIIARTNLIEAERNIDDIVPEDLPVQVRGSNLNNFKAVLDHNANEKDASLLIDDVNLNNVNLDNCLSSTSSIKHSDIKNVTFEGQGELIDVNHSKINYANFRRAANIQHSLINNMISNQDLIAEHTNIDAAFNHPLVSDIKAHFNKVGLFLNKGFALVSPDPTQDHLAINSVNKNNLYPKYWTFDNERIAKSKFFAKADGIVAYDILATSPAEDRSYDMPEDFIFDKISECAVKDKERIANNNLANDNLFKETPKEKDHTSEPEL